jgi:hypothetical protein
MSEPFRTPEDYELFLYTLVERFSVISRSTLVFVRVGASMARISGELFLQNGIKIIVRERMVFDRLPLLIDGYATKSGVEMRNCTGMIHSRIRMSLHYKVRIPIISISRQI